MGRFQEALGLEGVRSEHRDEAPGFHGHPGALDLRIRDPAQAANPTDATVRVRLLFEDGSLAAIARRAAGRLVPDKVLVPRDGAAPRG